MGQFAVINVEGLLLSVLGLALVVLLMPPYIALLKWRMLGQFIREDGPQTHLSKAGTPTAGGVVIVLAIVLSVVVWASGCLVGLGNLIRISIPVNTSVWVVLGATVALGLLGFTDDWLKIAKQKNKGVTGYTKLALQALVGVLVGVYAMQLHGGSGTINWFNWGAWPVGWCYPLFASVVLTGASNAVNLTDGLDGLATGTSIASFAAMAVLLATVWNAPDLSYLSLIVLATLMGFWLFNRKPALIFMGDTGSLALGGALASMAIIAQQECWLLLLGGVFVLEALSVIIQVASFKTRGKRLFRMSPIHHHFELGGLSGHGTPWGEVKTVWAFIVVQMALCAVCLKCLLPN
jgi:phospho-N-acetylmuramoyl-pentapeptide-transferase